MSESEVISDLVRQPSTTEDIGDRLVRNVDGTVNLPSPAEFWKTLVIALLSSQQKWDALERFSALEPFPLSLDAYREMTGESAAACIHTFRFAKRISAFLRKNHDWLFGDRDGWATVASLLAALVVQRNTAPNPAQKALEREVAHLLDNELWGVGPKQSRNLLQELGLTRYEIPLDSRVTAWLQDNLDWSITVDELTDIHKYEKWLDKLQTVCAEAGVLPTVFDAAAFSPGSGRPT